MNLLPSLRFTMYPWSIISNVTAVTRRDTNASVRPSMFKLDVVTDGEFDAAWKECEGDPNAVIPTNFPDSARLEAEVKLTLIYHMPTLPQILRSSPKPGTKKKEAVKPWCAINGFAPTTLFDPVLFPDTRRFDPKGRAPRVVFIDCRPHLDFHMVFPVSYRVPVKELLSGNILAPIPDLNKITINGMDNPRLIMRTSEDEGVASLNNIFTDGQLCTGHMGDGLSARIQRSNSLIGGCVSWMQDWVNQKPNTDLLQGYGSAFLHSLVETSTQIAYSPPENTKEWWERAEKHPKPMLENLCLPPLKPFPTTSSQDSSSQ